MKKTLIFSILSLIILLSCLGMVSAGDVNGTALFEDHKTDYLSSDNNLISDNGTGNNLKVNNVNEPSLSSNLTNSTRTVKDYTVNSSNFNEFFDENSKLKSEFGGSIIRFNGEFTDKSIIVIDSENTKITGKNALFNNTAFYLKANNIMLTNLNFVCNKNLTDNAYACILVTGSNVTIYNNTINYSVPKECSGFGIYADNLNNLQLINNTLNFYGNSLYRGYNYGIILMSACDSVLSGNNIYCELPLRDVDWSSQIYGGVSMDSVAGLAADSCTNLRLSDNSIRVNGTGKRSAFPTLDAVIIYACHNAVIERNHIIEEDFSTVRTEVNYLYGLDMYLSDNVMVYGNTIRVWTKGGTYRMGTAYPIQITGPVHNMRIAFNNITSFSYGPNIGIYSQNFYGTTEINIVSNFINVTGYGGSDSWALVAGIEAQDSNDVIMNNTIIVNSVNEFQKGYNVYGISYSQSTDGQHTYNIQYNNVTTNGRYAVTLKGSDKAPISDSIIANNLLINNGRGGNRAIYLLKGKDGHNNTIANNTNGSKTTRKMNAGEYDNILKNYMNNPFVINNTGRFAWIYGNTNGSGNSNNGHSIFNNGNGTNRHSFFNNGTSNVNNNVRGNNPNNIISQSANGSVSSNNYAVGSSGAAIASSSPSTGGGIGGSQASAGSKAYELSKNTTEKIKEDYTVPFGIIIIVIIILLLAGYKYRRDKED